MTSNRWAAVVGAAGLAVLLSGCAVSPAYPPGPGYSPPPPAGPAAYDAGYLPPVEYVVGGTPVYYEIEPGIPYYPIFLDTPGSCHCIVPMRYVNGVWLGQGGVVLHRGFFPYRVPPREYHEVWIRRTSDWGGRGFVRGQVETVAPGRYRPVPPPGMHSRPVAAPLPPAHSGMPLAPPRPSPAPMPPPSGPRFDMPASGPRPVPPMPMPSPPPPRQPYGSDMPVRPSPSMQVPAQPAPGIMPPPASGMRPAPAPSQPANPGGGPRPAPARSPGHDRDEPRR